ncbi:4-O-methyl-glucuronoyl methylesterase [Zalerion maritima]|uniref:(4-O-methyl)-D-glucuronate--lignin esterase n=1 Tax=Zalerion maritima TaxID=339359 RepID=A0AAD5RRG6_9PEZI|nr:4-O-methyl-glucuronoyl methylesterase [Zalerion maritima]
MKATTASFLLLATGAAAQQAVWGQCGGQGWAGATTCEAGTHCEYYNDWYSQCIPGGGDSPAPTAMTATQTPTVTTTQPGGSTTASQPPTTTGEPATCPITPSGLGSGTSSLNDPFTFHNGDKVTSKSLWECRREEILNLVQKYEIGYKPANPSSLSASWSGSTLSITVSENGKSTSFSVSISKPSGSGPFPAIIYYGTYGASIPIPNGVAGIAFNNDEIAAQDGGGSRGQGKFYDLYGWGHSAGALTAWAWAVSRIIDALEQTPDAGIDTARIGVTGCSRNGKGAFVAGALDERVALTLPQESGAGGAGCWRLQDWMNSIGYNVQGASQIVGENPWLGPAFNNYVNNVNQLSFDHHLLAGLVAPRPMYIMENPDFEWLGTMSTYGCMGAGKEVYDALGATDQFGYSQVGGHDHCSFPSSQGSELNAFINRYLLRTSSAATGVYRTDQSYSQLNMNDWITWSTPSLS